MHCNQKNKSDRTSFYRFLLFDVEGMRHFERTFQHENVFGSNCFTNF